MAFRTGTPADLGSISRQMGPAGTQFHRQPGLALGDSPTRNILFDYLTPKAVRDICGRSARFLSDHNLDRLRLEKFPLAGTLSMMSSADLVNQYPQRRGRRGGKSAPTGGSFGSSAPGASFASSSPSSGFPSASPGSGFTAAPPVASFAAANPAASFSAASPDPSFFPPGAPSEDASADFPSPLYGQRPQSMPQFSTSTVQAPPEAPRAQWTAPPPPTASPPRIDPELQEKLVELEAERVELRNEVDTHRGRITNLERQMFILLGKMALLEADKGSPPHKG
jgi:hypothetical protein